MACSCWQGLFINIQEENKTEIIMNNHITELRFLLLPERIHKDGWRDSDLRGQSLHVAWFTCMSLEIKMHLLLLSKRQELETYFVLKFCLTYVSMILFFFDSIIYSTFYFSLSIFISYS